MVLWVIDGDELKQGLFFSQSKRGEQATQMGKFEMFFVFFLNQLIKPGLSLDRLSLLCVRMLFTLGWWGGCSHVRLLVFVLLHSFTGCHGHCLQGEQLTAAFVISFITPCIPCISLLSISWQCIAKRPCFYPSSEAQFPDSPRRYPATPAHLEDAADRLLSSGWCPESVSEFFITRTDLEQTDPMSQRWHRSHHVPSIGCICKWKHHQPRHRLRRGAGEPSRRGEDSLFSVCRPVFLNMLNPTRN